MLKRNEAPGRQEKNRRNKDINSVLKKQQRSMSNKETGMKKQKRRQSKTENQAYIKYILN